MSAGGQIEENSEVIRDKFEALEGDWQVDGGIGEC